jgi:hypothetical protein
MKPANGNRLDVTHLKSCDHQLFFEALDCPPSPTDALQAAFRRTKKRSFRRNTWLPTMDCVHRSSGVAIDALRTATSLPQETTIVFFDEVAFPALWTLQYHHFQRPEGVTPSGGTSEDVGLRDGGDLRWLPNVDVGTFWRPAGTRPWSSGLEPTFAVSPPCRQQSLTGERTRDHFFLSIHLDSRPLFWMRLSVIGRGGSGAEPLHVILVVRARRVHSHSRAAL